MMEHKIHKTVSLFADIFFYVDAINGDDDNTGLYENDAFKTLQAAFELVSTFDPNYVIGIILGDGTYTQDDFIRETTNTNKIMIIGNTRTILDTPNGINMIHSGGGNHVDPCLCVMEYYRLIWTGNPGTNVCTFKRETNFYNIVFKDIGDSHYGYICAGVGGRVLIKNCSSVNCGRDFLRVDDTLSVINCIGNFTRGDTTSGSTFNSESNIFQVVQYDDKYKPTSVVYEDLGTGLDPDGTVANIGVYGGEYSWDIYKQAKYIIHQEGKYYTVINDTLEEVMDYENELDSKGCLIYKIHENLHLLNDQFMLIADEPNEIHLNAITSKTEMIVSKFATPFDLVDHITSIKIYKDTNLNSYIMCAFSVDKGITWKTYNGTSFEDLPIDIPLKDYNSFDEFDRDKWNNAKDVIFNNGINVLSTFPSVDFNAIDNIGSMLFAYVIVLTDVNDKCILKKTTCKYDEIPSYRLLNPDEISVNINKKSVKITPHIDSPSIKINIVPNGFSQSNSEGSSNIELGSEDDINSFINNLSR